MSRGSRFGIGDFVRGSGYLRFDDAVDIDAYRAQFFYRLIEILVESFVVDSLLEHEFQVIDSGVKGHVIARGAVGTVAEVAEFEFERHFERAEVRAERSFYIEGIEIGADIESEDLEDAEQESFGNGDREPAVGKREIDVSGDRVARVNFCVTVVDVAFRSGRAAFGARVGRAAAYRGYEFRYDFVSLRNIYVF